MQFGHNVYWQTVNMNAALLLFLLLGIYIVSVRSRASVTVAPNKSQYFEYEKMSVSCEQFGSGEWRVWRYATKGLLSRCGVDWGSETSSTCVINTVKQSDSGVYWCESKHRESSNAVSITVKTGGSLILQSPALPVTEGDDVTLYCKTKTSNPSADFYKNGSHIRTEPTGQMTIHHVSKSDEGLYKCNISSHGESSPSWLRMKEDSVLATLTVTPDSSQLFEYESLSLSCGENSSSTGWGVRRAVVTSDNNTYEISSCGDKWGTVTVFGCTIQTAKQPDSAIYWCESAARQRSNSASITVHGGPVILQNPVLPVMEGDNVTLHCKTKTSNLPADFYKDGSLIRTEPAGHMTIHYVSKSDEGLYKCHNSSHGESPPSWLFVRGLSTAEASHHSLLRIISFVVACCPYCISTVLMVSSYRHKPTGRRPAVSMTTSAPLEDDEAVASQYDDVTTEHHF
ncbi:neural cell adhesion molecule 2-like isoform X1 [Thunnus albacares]|uniref:neural cell adhesion molecule 2-like isoform X1 n=2 Tax=Thunnus albacares TaxID=8236 RepID=UPI001CF65840|nr:neural cell adhesion molecule 2-like isoform X1 [Thunnus albacares]